jgi:predicted porin
MRKIFTVLVLAALVGTAFAQTSTPPALGQPGSLAEVYGVLDGALRYSTNAYEPSASSYFGLSQGLFQGSRFGIRGTEDLGAGFKAIYDLEAGVILPTGGLDQQQQLFGRQAWVGASSPYGTLSMGRQYGTFSDSIGAGDVFGVNHGNGSYNNGSNYATGDAVNAFFQQEMGFRWNNSIKYAANFNGLTAGAMVVYGMDFGAENMYAASLGYSSKDVPISGSVAFQEEQDVALRNHYDLGGGLKYALDPTDGVYLFYMYSNFDSGFTQINSTDSEFSGTTTLNRTDSIANLAANYYVTSSFNLIASYYFDYAQNILTSGDNGTRNSILVSADYFFSKNFDFYLAGSYTMFSGVLGYSANGGDVAITDASAPTLGAGTTGSKYTYPTNGSVSVSNVIDVMLGMRFRF